MTEAEAKDFACRMAALAIRMERLKKSLRQCYYDGPKWYWWALNLRMIWWSIRFFRDARRAIRKVGDYDQIWSRLALDHLTKQMDECEPMDLSIAVERVEE